MSKSLPKKPPKSTEGENVVTWLAKGLAKNWNFSILRSICIFLDKLWLNQRKTTEKLIRTFHPCEIFSEICQIFKWCDLVDYHRLALSNFKWKFVCFLHFWAQEGSIHLPLSAIENLLSWTFSSKGNGQPYFKNKSSKDNYWQTRAMLTKYWWKMK